MNNINKKYIRNRLEKSNNNTVNGGEFASYTQNNVPIFSNSNEMEDFLCSQNDGIKKNIIHFIYKHKELFRKIPFLGTTLIKRKNIMFKNAVETVILNKIIEIDNIVAMYIDDFIYAAYQVLLLREPDPQGFAEFKRTSYQGASNGAIAYIIISSAEFANRFKVRNIRRYRKEFNNYKRRQYVLKIPFIGKVFNLFLLSSRINIILNHLDNTELRLSNSINLMHKESIVRDNILSEHTDQLIRKIDKNHHSIDKSFENIGNNFKHIDKMLDDINKVIIDEDDNNMNFLSKTIELLQSNIKITTSVSEKIDYIPSFIAQNNLKNKSIITSNRGGVLAVQVGDFVMGIPSEEWGLAMFLSLNGHFEPGSEKVFCSLLEEGMVVVDVGANVGIYTLHALKAGCEVYSYEPTPTTYELLNQNIKANGFAENLRANTYNLAVSDIEKTTSFKICQGMCGHNHLAVDEDDMIEISAVTLDHHLKKRDNVDIIKIDVEGEEYNVLKGMRNIIKNNPQIKILIEFAPQHLKRSGVNPKDLLGLIKDYGLTVRKVDENTATLSRESDEILLKEVSVNLLLTYDK